MIPYGKHYIDGDDIQAVVEVLKSGVLTQGPAVDAFEKEVADYVGAKFAVAVSSGTAALHLAALAAGVNSRSSVVTSPITFIASANAALYAGGKVLFADVDPNTINLSPQSLKSVLNKNADVKVVIPVHFAGLPCEMLSIKVLADAAGAVVIEDAAHALGATYPNGDRVGSCTYSLMTTFSFHPVKAIAAGEGGMITTNDELIYRKLIRLRSHGTNKLDDQFLLPLEAAEDGKPNPWYYEMQELGFHYRITDIQCALALSQFKKLDKFISRRRALVEKYNTAILKMKNCRPAQNVGQDQSGHHLYAIRVDFDSIGLSRGDLMRELNSRGIGSQVHYIPVPEHPYYRDLGFMPEDYPVAKKYYQEALTIPLFFELTNEQQNKIIYTIQELIG